MISDKLKKSVIDFAIKGDLTNPDIGDESTILSLERLSLAKRRLVTERKIYKKKPTAPFYELDNIPIDIPDSWQWIQLSDVSIIQEGAGIRKYQYTDSGVQLLSVTNILDGQVDLAKKQLFVSTDEFQNKYTHLRLNEGDIVTACSGGSWGKVAIYEQDDVSMLNTSTLRLRFFDDIANNKFLYYVVKSEFFKQQLREQLVGMQPNFGYAHYSRIMIPFPPIKEQKRIVDRLDELLPLIDSLEKDELKLKDLMQQFPKNMKAAILQAAIQGKITEQNSDIENTLWDYNNDHIFLQQSSVDEYPFDIPENWAWVRMVDIIKLGNGTKLSNVESKYLDVKYLRKKSEPTYVKTGRFIQAGSRIILVDGENSGEIFVTNEDGYMGSTFRTLELKYNSIWDYLRIFLEFHKSTFKNNKTGSAIPHLNKQLFNNLLVPVPPIAEQKRIIERLKQLLPIVDNINVE